MKLSAIVKEDGSPTAGTVKHLLIHHFPVDEGVEDELDREDTQALSGDDPDFSLKELESVLKWLNRGKAPGLDGLPLEIIICVYRANKALFLGILNKILQSGKFPQSWKTAQLILFNKVGKDRSDPANYRPVCLLPAWSKVLDKLITNRIFFCLSRGGHLNRNQFGFTPGKGTEDAITSVKDTIKANQHRKLDTTLVMLDVKGAFNSLGWRSILQALIKIGCPRNIYQLVRSYLQDRRVVYSTPISVQEHSYSRGCPQGSCSGPLFWLLVANSQLEMDLGPHVTTVAYADDFVVLVTGPNAHVVSRRANIALEKIAGWAELHKLQFSAAKTSAVLFRKPHDGGRRRAPRAPPRIRFLGTAVKAVKTQQYLGYTIDDKLN